MGTTQTPDQNSNRDGFTIVELLIVVVVIAILAAITIVAYNGIQSRSRMAALQSGLSQAAKKLETEKIASGSDSYPSNLASVGISTPANTTYDYRASASAYCLSGTSSGVSFRVIHTSPTPAEGSCAGILADGSTCPAGYIAVPGSSTFGTSDFCVMKYEAKNAGGVATSQAVDAPWVSISQISAISTAAVACAGCHLISEAEWMTIAQNALSVASNWSGGAVGSGYVFSGHSDGSPASSLAASSTDNDGYSGTGNTSGNQRRTLTLTNGEVIWDLSGNTYEWTSATIAGNVQPGLAGESAFAYKQWNDPSLQWGSLPNLSRASAVASLPSLSGISGWTSAQGIGQLYSNLGTTGSRGFIRGGYLVSGAGAGVLALSLAAGPTYVDTIVGFRVAR